MLVHVDRIGKYAILGQTLDDAAGEALDKGANLLKLGYPGGPAIEKAAEGGNPAFYKFPRGLEHPKHHAYSFSFSGLKTALLYYVREHPTYAGSGDPAYSAVGPVPSPGAVRLSDVAASYQEAVFDGLLTRAGRALEAYPVKAFACVGGVARNKRLRAKLEELARGRGVELMLAKPEYCTDNAAMIAAVAAHHAAEGIKPSVELDIDPNLPLV
jgi:N6-L-threonylcarbamoyladenine synthase